MEKTFTYTFQEWEMETIIKSLEITHNTAKDNPAIKVFDSKLEYRSGRLADELRTQNHP